MAPGAIIEPPLIQPASNISVKNGITAFEPLPDVKNIMITGGGGFIGSWLAYALASTYKNHYRVVIFDKFPAGAVKNNHYDDGTTVALFKGDIGLDEDVSTCIEAYNVDTIIHLSAQTSVDTSLADPYGSTKANVVGTHVVLENASKGGVKRFIHMSSAEVYGAARPSVNGYKEDALCMPLNPYGASKAASEVMVNLYGSKGMITHIVRSCNVYGPKQFPDKLIPKSITLLQNGAKVTIHGTGADVKRWLYVTDCSNAFNTILHRGQPGAVYNLGSHHLSSNYELCSTMIKTVISSKDGVDAETINVEDYMNKIPGRNFKDAGVGMDFSDLERLGWTQHVSLKEGVAKCVDWYGQYASNWWGDLVKILKL